VLKELTERMHALEGAPSWEETLRKRSVPFDAEAFKRAADEMVREAGVLLLLHAMAVDTIVEHGRITAVVLESKSGREAAVGRVFVDGTGDADIAYRAGAQISQGRSFDGSVESMGSFVHIGGIEDVTPEQATAARGVVEAAMTEGRLRFYHGGFSGANDMHHDHYSPNMTRWPGDSTNTRHLSAAEVGVRDQVWKLWELLRKQPGFQGCYIQQTSPQVGPRESRQIVGDYVLTGDDVHSGAKFGDAVARGSWWIDIHCPLGHTYPVHLCVTECPRADSCPYWKAEHEGEMRTTPELYPPDDDWYDIPYRCLTPKGVDNLLVSGRCISADHQGMAGARVMGPCMAVGQAAGTAAAMAAKGDGSVRGVDVTGLREALTADGALV